MDYGLCRMQGVGPHISGYIRGGGFGVGDNLIGDYGGGEHITGGGGCVIGGLDRWEF